MSLIKADTSTCNGIQPHPKLPIFITYGIDSTAKIWRATSPVDMNVDDSDIGRYMYQSKQARYQKSVVVDKWKKGFKGKDHDFSSYGKDFSFFPDEVSEEDDNSYQDHFLSLFMRSRPVSQDAPYIGNDLTNLRIVASQNYFACTRSVMKGLDEPVKSGIVAMKNRVSLIKLRHQADMLGLDFNSDTPWILKHKKLPLKRHGSTGVSGGGHPVISVVCLADLIPDNPSDWLPFDKLMANPPHPGGMHFNSKYEDYHLDLLADHSVPPISRQVCLDELCISGDVRMVNEDKGGVCNQLNTLQASGNPISQSAKSAYDPAQAWDILIQTVSLLRDAGNDALKASLPFAAARRYDKAINYCALAYIEFPVGTMEFLTKLNGTQVQNPSSRGYKFLWNDLLKLLIAVRLNLALVNLAPEINDARGAMALASLSLKELQPFATITGSVLTKNLAHARTNEPQTTYVEAKTLQAKAYFRLGSAQLVLSEYDEAVKSFEQCVASTKEANLTVDSGVLRKINEAKRCRKEKKEKQRKKFKLMFSSTNG